MWYDKDDTTARVDQGQHHERSKSMRARDGEDVQLTQEEHAVLAASARGLHVLEVAVLLDQPAETVRQRIASAVQKLGARSKLEAVVLALRRGLIDLSE